MKEAVILLSGGMDSAVLLQYLMQKLNRRDVHALSFLYGQKHCREIEMARVQAGIAGVKEHRIIEMPWLAELVDGASALTEGAIPVPDLDEIEESSLNQPPTYVPNRNMVFLSLAAAYAEAAGISDVFYGAQAQDEYGYWDCTVDFVSRMNELLALNRGKRVIIHAPFAEKTKSEVARLGRAMGVDFNRTWSCYRGGEEPCGKCPSCIERERAIKEVSL